ncbi:unnamed protein product [Ectocarpus sp. 12 AP-2014]
MGAPWGAHGALDKTVGSVGACKIGSRRYPPHSCPSHVSIPCHRSAAILIDHVPRRLPPDLWARREAAVALVLGWLGLRAWWCYDARAAKFNLWLCPSMYLMMVVMMAIQVTKEMSYGRHPVWGLYVLIGLFQIVLPLMYRSKVMWSYQMLLLRRTSRAARDVAMVELDASSPTV